MGGNRVRKNMHPSLLLAYVGPSFCVLNEKRNEEKWGKERSDEREIWRKLGKIDLR